ADYQRLRASTAAALTIARDKAIQVLPHATNSKDHQAAIRDLLERREVNDWMDTLTLSEIVTKYESAKDDEQRALVRDVESGVRPKRISPDDVAAAVRLSKLVRARKAGRIPAALRTAFKLFSDVTNTRGVKSELIAMGAIK